VVTSSSPILTNSHKSSRELPSKSNPEWSSREKKMLISDAVTLSEELMRKENKVQEMVELQNKRSSIS
jgi:hypothetical protein